MGNSIEQARNIRVKHAQEIQENIRFNEAFFEDAIKAMEDTGIIGKIQAFAAELEVADGVTDVFLHLPDLDINNVFPGWPLDHSYLGDNGFYKSGRERASKLDANLTWVGKPSKTYKELGPGYDTIQQNTWYGFTVTYHAGGCLEFQSSVGTAFSKGDTTMGLQAQTQVLSPGRSRFLMREDWQRKPDLVMDVLTDARKHPKVELHKMQISHDERRS